ncbi:hypothetical protein BH09CHL1_BH09CHL1_14150 [soil metagenome]
MVQNEDPILRITVNPADSLAELLPRIREHRGRPVFLTIPTQSPLFLTASEFRALRETVRSHGVNFTLISEDAQRRDYANLFNLTSVSEEPEGWPNADSTPGTPATPTDPALGSGRPRRPLGSIVNGERRSDAPAGAGSWSSSWPSQAEPAAGSPNGWPQRREESTSESPTVSTETALAVIPPEPVEVKKRRRRRWPWITLVVVLLVAGLAAAGVFVPSATVTITGARTPITTSVVFGVTSPGTIGAGFTDVAFTVPGTRQQTTVTVSATVPATGQQNAPGEPASGTIAFANPGDQAVTVAAGTQVVSDQGVAFTVAADVSVPAAAGNISGTANGTVTAVVGGITGNLAQGALSGQLDSGVYFSNRDAALAGGTDATLPVVTEEDIANATAQLETLLPEQASQALTDAAGSPIAVVPDSIGTHSFQTTSDVPAGTQAAQVTVSGTTSVTMLTYDPVAAEAQIKDSALSLATTAAPGSFDENSVQIGNPLPTEGDVTGGLVEVPVTLDRLLDLDEAQIEELKDDIAMRRESEAETIISEVDGVESIDIVIDPSWWPGGRMPVTPDRIDVVVK